MTWGCWRDEPLCHPWLGIDDTACGYDDRLRDPRCAACHRCRAESPLDQLIQINGRGDAARQHENP